MTAEARDALKNRWIRSGVTPGDTLLVHSNIARTSIVFRRAGFSAGPDEILESFLDALGHGGTLLLPLFNFDFADGIGFDIRTTPSRMGALTEAGRLHRDAVRTGHPIYSFAAIGQNAKAFEKVDNESGYAEDSPFGILKRMDGKIAALDLSDQDCMTFYHHVEEIKRVDYRYFKTFCADYTDVDAVTRNKCYTLYVRDIDRGVKTRLNPAGELMWQSGLYRGCRPGVDTGLRVVKAGEMFRFVARLIDEGRAPGMLYAIEK